ncbi:MAG: hypothetical protein KAQ62_25475, partial [Cyclobacteriaceae bacterium]|nr:hypothetical protein [Cyclobacteriaceae bacterium]
PATAKTFCEKMATRFVAFATAGGNPKKINMGKLSNEPPPAIVLIIPAANPTPNINRTSNKSIDK